MALDRTVFLFAAVAAIHVFHGFLPCVTAAKFGLGDGMAAAAAAKGKYDDYKGYWDAGSYGGQTYAYCESAGIGDCGTRAFVCGALKFYGGEAFGYVESVRDHYCLGEPVLKCCRTLTGCHSAFNSEAPINCEGNPHYGPTYTAGPCQRPCPDNNCAGCVCYQHADCQEGAPSDPPGYQCSFKPCEDENEEGNRRDLEQQEWSSIQSHEEDVPPLFQEEQQRGLQIEVSSEEWFAIGRLDAFFYKLSSAIKGRPALSSETDADYPTTRSPLKNTAKYGTPITSLSQQMLDYVFYRGCTSFVENAVTMFDKLPQYNFTDWWGDQVSVDDTFRDWMPVRLNMVYFVAYRLAMDIPQFWQKVEHATSLVWTDEMIDDALEEAGVSDPEGELLRYVDVGGLAILQRTLTGRMWELLAVPPKSDGINLAESQDGPNSITTCREGNGRGEPVQITDFTVSISGDTASVRVDMTDPLQSETVITQLSWGDMSDVETFGSLQVTAEHTYTQCNPPPQVTLQVVNKSGLKTLAKQTVTPSCVGSLSDLSLSSTDYPPIVSVEVMMMVKIAGNSFGGPGSQFYQLEGVSPQGRELNATDLQTPRSPMFDILGQFTSTSSRTTLPANLTVPMDVAKVTPIQYLRFTCRTTGHYVHTTVQAKIDRVRVALLSGTVVDLAFSMVTHEFGVHERCSRRGNVYEDSEKFYGIRLEPIQMGSVVTPEDGVSATLSIEELSMDGFYQEALPGSFRFASKLQDLGGGGGNGGEEATCLDKNGKSFKTYLQKGKKQTTCEQLSNAKSKLRKWYCKNVSEMAENCPLTCGLCTDAMCTDSSTASFPLYKRKKTNCKKLNAPGRDPEEVSLACHTHKIAKTCRATCDSC